jgi:hypothetical protein
VGSVKLVAQDIPEYDELSLRIQAGRGDAYRVLVQAPGGETVEGEFSNPFGEYELDNFVLSAGVPRRTARGFRSSSMERAKDFGSRLHNALLQGEVRDLYLGARRSAEERHRGLRVTLCLTDAPELMEIPWEFLYERPQFLAQSMFTPVVRSLDLETIREAWQVRLPLRILGMVSSPAGFPSLDVEEEKQKVEESLGPLIEAGVVQVNWLPSATLAELDKAISAPDEEHVLHYIGHGAYDQRSQDGILVLEDPDGRPREVSGAEVSTLLQDERSMRLVVLNACEGARGSHVDPFSGVASSIVECGIPAVIGMQFEITDEAAIAFSERLYRALAHGYPVDAALAQARKAIFAGGNDIEFGTPVLFLRSGDARLFHPEDVPSTVPEREPEPAQEPAQDSVPMDQLMSAFREELQAPSEDATDWSAGATVATSVQHDGRVTGVAISPDGSLLASASKDKTARLWSMPDGTLLARLDHGATVTAVAFSPVERKLATSAEEFGAWLWDVDTGNRVFYPGTEARALSHDVAISPDGRQVAYGVANNRALVFEIETGALVAELDHKGGLLGNVQALEFSSSGLWLVTGSARTGRLWDLDDGTLVTMVRHGGRMQTVIDVASSPDGGSFATVAQDGIARIWSFPSGDLQKELHHDKSLHAIDFSPGGGYVATACQDSKARIWNVRTGELVTELEHAEPVLDVAFSPDGTQLAAASGSYAHVWAADG